MKKIALIGSTGSIGEQVLNVVRHNRDLFEIVSLSAGYNIDLLYKQINEFSPKVVSSITELPEKQGGIEYFSGENSFVNCIIPEADVVVIALVGFTGIIAVLDAINKKKNIALANKESLVIGGELVCRLAEENNVSIIPIDSEHSAIWQALSFDFHKNFKRLILTASGGAFRDLPLNELSRVTVNQALNHPNWKMGNKITVDCATMVNKAFEVTEAKWLYNTDFSKIDVIIHKESIIHSMVEYNDNSVIAQLSYPNMELPIQLALSYPERIKSNIESLDFAKIGKLSFQELDNKRYPCFDLVMQASKKGGLYNAVVNGANDTAVEMFLKGKINFTEIYKALDYCLQKFDSSEKISIESITNANNFSVNTVSKLFGE